MQVLIRIFSLFYLLLMATTQVVVAVDQVQIKDHTDSKKSLIINKGSLDGLKEGDYGYFYFQESKDSPKLIKVAKVVLVQLSSTHSSWLLKETFRPEFINRQQSLVLYSRSRHDLGRRDFRIRNNKVYLQNETVSDNFIEDKEIGAPKEQRLLEDLYTKENKDITLTLREGEDTDVESTEFHKFVVKVAEEKERFSVEQDGRYVETEALRDVYEDEYYQDTLDGWEKKANGFDSLEAMYKKRLKGVDVEEGQEFLTVNNSYREALEQKKDKTFLNRRAIKKMSTEGATWSADMDDQEIRKFIVNSGILEESERKQFALRNALGHEFYARYSFGMTQNTTDEDNSYQGPSFGLAFGYELLLERLHVNFRRFTMDFGLEFANNYFDPEIGTNIKSVENSFGAKINYYFWNYPTTMDRILFFAGYGMKAGSAKFESSTLSKNYNYQMRSFAILQAGLKYRVGASDLWQQKMGVGLIVQCQYETQTYTSDEENTDNLDGDININDLKLSTGLSFYF